MILARFFFPKLKLRQRFKFLRCHNSRAKGTYAVRIRINGKAMTPSRT